MDKVRHEIISGTAQVEHSGNKVNESTLRWLVGSEYMGQRC